MRMVNTDINKISIQRIVADDVQNAVFHGLDLINARHLMKKNMKVLLKPNLLSPNPPERAVTTHPEVVRAVIKWVKQFEPSIIYVCDSSGGMKRGKTEESFKESGILEVCQQEKVNCISFEKTQSKLYKVPNPLILEEFTSSRLLSDVDLIINLPKIKTHWQCELTCCIKNFYGTVILANKMKYHAKYSKMDDFGSALADIYSVFKPQLSVIDGYYAMEGNGPAAGEVVKSDLIVTGYDPVALDTLICKLIGMNPNRVNYILKAEKKKLGNSNFDTFEISGENIDKVVQKFKLPNKKAISVKLPKKFADYIAGLISKASVSFDPKKCKVCGTCWINCPVKAIKPPSDIKRGNIPAWDRETCISCYCCGELCPEEAVDLKVNVFRNVIFSKVGISLISLIGIILLLILLV